MASGSHHSSGSHSGSHHSSHSSSSSHHSSSHRSYSHSSYHSSSVGYRGSMHARQNYVIPKRGVLYNERDIFPNRATYDEYMQINENSQSVHLENNPNATLEGANQSVSAANHQYVSSEDLIVYTPRKKKSADDEYSPQKEEKLSYGASWVSESSYCLNTRDPYFLQHYPTPSRPDPRVILIIFGIISFLLFGFAASNLEYELFIRPFEAMTMNDATFTFIDNLIYYGQFIIPFIVFFIGFILSKKKHKQNEMFVREMIKFYGAEEERLHYERTHEFLAVCTQCGAPRQPGDISCQFCGASLVREI